MCRGKPKFHPCGHQSVKYLHCPRATVDPTTNKTIPCNNVEYSSSQTLNSHCSIDECYWTSSAGVWYCCQCGHGPNPLGSCEGQSTRHGQPWRPSGVERPATQTCMHLWCRYCNPPTPGSECRCQTSRCVDANSRDTQVLQQTPFDKHRVRKAKGEGKVKGRRPARRWTGNTTMRTTSNQFMVITRFLYTKRLRWRLGIVSDTIHRRDEVKHRHTILFALQRRTVRLWETACHPLHMLDGVTRDIMKRRMREVVKAGPDISFLFSTRLIMCAVS
ncbi:hypothetical protein BX600DRAFT_87571 [Xylariales sp. PMI_506]|nr:hypothetical protein BX600DRAFT_87571 [Xylariales sp. PMI_506]